MNNTASNALSIVGGRSNIKTAATLKSTSKRIKNSNELRVRNHTNRLSKAIYNHKKEQQLQKSNKYARRYYANVPRKSNGSYWNSTTEDRSRKVLDEYNAAYVINFLKRTNPELYNTIRRGNLFINVSHPRAYNSSSRGHIHGIYIFNKVAKKVVLRPINRSLPNFEYGGIPKNFKVITQFPNPNYWKMETVNKNVEFTHLPNGKPNHYWYHYDVTVPLKDLKNSIKFTNNGKFEVNHLGLKYYVNASNYYSTNEIKKLNNVLINQNEFPITKIRL